MAKSNKACGGAGARAQRSLPNLLFFCPCTTLLTSTDLVTSGVAFHHAGVHVADRHAIEKGYLEGQIHVICCTSTLAVGVNLPCHMVIIKNTVCYHDDGIKEYSDLEMMQMLGRAGRPQFDDSAVAVIITKEEKKGRYERLVAGQDVLESCLHLNLIEHLNVEIGLGTVFDVNSAKRWLAGTFLAVRLQRNPSHYKLGDEAQVQDLQESISQICRRDISLLEDHDIVRYDQGNNKLRCTEFGEAMSRYYVKFETMKVFLGLEPRAKISDIVSSSLRRDSQVLTIRSFRSSCMLMSITRYESVLQRRGFSKKSTVLLVFDIQSRLISRFMLTKGA